MFKSMRQKPATEIGPVNVVRNLMCGEDNLNTRMPPSLFLKEAIELSLSKCRNLLSTLILSFIVPAFLP